MAEHEGESIDEVIEELEEFAEHRRRVCIADILDEFGHRSYGPFLVILPLIDISPIGAIPGVPSLLALMIAIVAVQLMLHRDHIWMPDFIQKRTIRGRKLAAALKKVEGVAHFLDSCCAGRLAWLAHGVPVRIAALCIVLLCLTVPPLELLPFAASVPMIAIAAFGVALTVRDGLLMIVAASLTLGAFGFGAYMFATQAFAWPFS
jgi:hypothetical protein